MIPEGLTVEARQVVEARTVPVNRRVSLIASLLAGVTVIIGIVGFAVHNLGNRYFWADESSTFLNSLGWPTPGNALGSFQDMWFGTTHNFLDPGIFHIVLRYWIQISNSSMPELRLFPFVLFLAYVIGLLALSRTVRAPWYAAFGVVGIMLLENITPYYAVEVRPYSGGQAASVLIPLLALLLIRHTRIVVLIPFVVGFIFFASMQFNSVPVTIGTVVMLGAVLWSRWKSRSFRWNRELTLLAIGAVIALVWLPALYLASRGMPTNDPHAAVIYMDSTIMRYQPLDRILNEVFANLFSPTALPRTIFVVVLPLVWWRRRFNPFSSSWTLQQATIALLWIYVLVSTVAAAASAALGFLPWVVGTRWSITDIGLIAVSVIGLLGIFMDSRLSSRKVLAVSLLVISLIACVLGAMRFWRYDRIGNIDYLSSLAPALLSGEKGRAEVDYWIYNDVRYWLEFNPEYQAYRDQWVDSAPIETTQYHPANTAEIESFLASQHDRMLLRSHQALVDSGVELPDSVSIVEVPEAQLGNVSRDEAPILLVKRTP